jgi:RNase P/RNase MRP subunit p30
LSYFESRLKVNFNNINEINEKLNICEKLGIRNVIIESTNYFKEINPKLKNEIIKHSKLRVYYRYNLSLGNVNEFKREIKRFSGYPYILSVESSNKEVQIQAARDSRVDILSFSNPFIIKSLTPGVISLIKQNKSFIEFSLASIMIKNFSNQSKNLRNLYRFIHIVRKMKAPYIISGNFNEIFDYRNPKNLISTCYTLLDIPLIEVKNIFKENPLLLIKRASEKSKKSLSKNGVKLIKSE